MGRETVRHEPNSMDALQNCPEAYHIFIDAGWIEYFQKLEGSDEAVAIEFAQNLNNNQTQVRGMQLEVTEEVISWVTSLPVEGRR